MKKRKFSQKQALLRKKHAKKLKAYPIDRAKRDPETNAYIPSDTEVADAKAWMEFCKL